MIKGGSQDLFLPINVLEVPHNSCQGSIQNWEINSYKGWGLRILVWFTITSVLLWMHGSTITYKEKNFSSTLTSKCCICLQYLNTSHIKKKKKKDNKETYPWGRTSMGHAPEVSSETSLQWHWISPPEKAALRDPGDRLSPWPNFRQAPQSPLFD